MTDREPPADFADVNEAVGADWEAETTPYERIRHVIAHSYRPLKADSVADEARTAPKTARKHLNTLTEEGFVTTTTGDNGATLYRRSPESLVMEQAADILQEVSIDELNDRIQTMRKELSEFQKEFDADSPEALVVEQTNHILSESILSESDGAEAQPDPETIREWKTLRRNLAFSNAALSIGTAEQFVDGERQTTGEGVDT